MCGENSALRAGIKIGLRKVRSFARRWLSSVVILMYHRVVPRVDNDPFLIQVSVENFGQHMNYLAQGYRVISLETLVEEMKKGAFPQKRQVVITFDDGYGDSYRHAYPILKKYQLPATIFLTADYIRSKREFWWDRLLRIVWNANSGGIDIGIPILRKYQLGTREERLAALHDLWSQLRDIRDQERNRIIDRIAASLGQSTDTDEEDNLPLTWSQVRNMMGDPICFGAHTCSHLVLSQLHAEEAREEITRSKEVIEANIGRKINFFAYPYGSNEDFNREVQDLVRNAGYLCACSTLHGANLIHSDLFALKRVHIKNWDLATFVRRVAHAFGE